LSGSKYPKNIRRCVMRALCIHSRHPAGKMMTTVAVIELVPVLKIRFLMETALIEPNEFAAGLQLVGAERRERCGNRCDHSVTPLRIYHETPAAAVSLVYETSGQNPIQCNSIVTFTAAIFVRTPAIHWSVAIISRCSVFLCIRKTRFFP
jgi:hypothetical protein